MMAGEDEGGWAHLMGALECLLFISERPLRPKDLARVLGMSSQEAERLAEALREQYSKRGLQIAKVAGGYEMCTRPEYATYVERLHPPRRFRLSRAAIETLAIVAYRQPVTRPEIERVRGVGAEGVISTLVGHGLVREMGRKKGPGRPHLYGTTDSFLHHFGLDSLDDLPPLPQEMAA